MLAEKLQNIQTLLFLCTSLFPVTLQEHYNNFQLAEWHLFFAKCQFHLLLPRASCQAQLTTDEMFSAAAVRCAVRTEEMVSLNICQTAES